MGIITTSYIFINIICVVYTFSTLFNFVFFISGEKSGLLEPYNVVKDAIWRPILWNASLLILFILSHLIMANSLMKTFFDNFGLASIHRSCYIAVSSFFIQVIINHWVTVLPDQTPLIWSNKNETFVLVCQVLQLFGWFLTFSIVYVLDIAEFFGIKQVYYEYYNLGCPLSSKTPQAQEYYSKMRHPSLIGALLILWMVPCLSIDRFLLASVFTLFPIFASRLTDKNYEYVKTMYQQKKISVRHFSYSG